MIARTVKLRPTREQAAKLDELLWIGTGVWNWALGQFIAHERGQRLKRPTYPELCRLTRGHAKRIGVCSQMFNCLLRDVCIAWDDCRAGVRGRPRWKSKRNRMASIPTRNNKPNNTLRREGRRAVRFPVIGAIRWHEHRDWPEGTICTARIQKRARGWYVTLKIEADPRPVPLCGDESVGIDLGYSTLATLSTGEKIEHPNEYRRLEHRIGQAARSLNRNLLGRLQQSLTLARRTRNHQISRDLVSRFGSIYVSKDNLRGLQQSGWGKSVLSAGHGELRQMLATKSRQAGRVYLEVSNRNSTRTCSSCQALTGPAGLHGLKVREWACVCGATHDRDVSAAVNTLKLGAVLAHESAREGMSEIRHRSRPRAPRPYQRPLS